MHAKSRGGDEDFVEFGKLRYAVMADVCTIQAEKKGREMKGVTWLAENDIIFLE